MQTEFNHKVTMLGYTLDEEGSTLLHIKWNGSILIRHTPSSTGITMDADDLLDLLVDSRCGMRSLIDVFLDNHFSRDFKKRPFGSTSEAIRLTAR